MYSYIIMYLLQLGFTPLDAIQHGSVPLDAALRRRVVYMLLQSGAKVSYIL